MKIHIEAKTLSKALETVNNCIIKKTTEDSFNSVLFSTVSDSELKIIANNRESGIEVVLPVHVEEQGSFCIKHEIFYAISKKFDSDVSISSDEKEVTIESKNLKMVFPAVSNETKELIKDHYDICMKIDSVSLYQAICSTIFVAKDKMEQNGSKALTGINFKMDNGMLVLTAIDSCKIARTKTNYLEYKEYTAKPFEATIPKIKVNSLKNLLKEKDDVVTIYANSYRVLFLFDSVKFMTSVISDSFIDISPILKMNYENSCDFLREEFLPVLERAKIMIDSNMGKKFHIHFEEKQIKTEINSMKGGFKDCISADVSGEHLKMILNPEYLYEIIHSIKDKHIHFYYSSPKKPCMIKNEDSLYLLTPINY